MERAAVGAEQTVGELPHARGGQAVRDQIQCSHLRARAVRPDRGGNHSTQGDLLVQAARLRRHQIVCRFILFRSIPFLLIEKSRMIQRGMFSPLSSII